MASLHLMMLALQCRQRRRRPRRLSPSPPSTAAPLSPSPLHLASSAPPPSSLQPQSSFALAFVVGSGSRTVLRTGGSAWLPRSPQCFLQCCSALLLLLLMNSSLKLEVL